MWYLDRDAGIFICFFGFHVLLGNFLIEQQQLNLHFCSIVFWVASLVWALICLQIESVIVCNSP
jgi:hypothetical protein